MGTQAAPWKKIQNQGFQQTKEKTLRVEFKDGVIFKEKAGVISKDPCWVAFVGAYMYTADTLFGLLRVMVKEWKLDKNLW